MSHVTCHVSHVTCHMSRVMCHVSRVTCHVSHVFIFLFLIFLGQSGEAYPWRVCYQRGLPRLVYFITVRAISKGKSPSTCQLQSFSYLLP